MPAVHRASKLSVMLLVMIGLLQIIVQAAAVGAANNNISPSLVLPATVSCIEDGFVHVSPILIDDTDAAEHFQSRLAVNVTTTHGKVSFPSLIGVRVKQGGGAPGSGGTSADTAFSLEGTLANIQKAFSGMLYHAPSSGELHPSDEVHISVVDMHQVLGTWVLDHAPLLRTAAVSIVNKQSIPMLAAPDRVTCDSSETKSVAVSVSYGGADAASREFSVTLTALHGSLALASGACSVTAAKKCEYKATLTDVNAALAGLAYTSDDARSTWLTGLERVQILLTDASGTAVLAKAEVVIVVNPVNVAPVITAPKSIDITENGMISLTSESVAAHADSVFVPMRVEVDDENSEDIITVQITTDKGVLTKWDNLVGVAAEIDNGGTASFVSASKLLDHQVSQEALTSMHTSASQRYRKAIVSVLGNDEASTKVVTLKGPKSYINQALTRIVYCPPESWHGVDQIAFDVSDLAGASAQWNAVVLISAVDQLPYIEMPSSVVNGVEDTEIPLVGLHISDMDLSETPHLLRVTIESKLGSVNFPLTEIESNSTTKGARFLSGPMSGESVVVGDIIGITALLEDLSFMPAANVNSRWIQQPGVVFSVAEFDVKTSAVMSDTTYSVVHFNVAPVDDKPQFSDVESYPHILEDQSAFLLSNITIVHADVGIETLDYGSKSIHVNVTSDRGVLRLAVGNNSINFDLMQVTITELLASDVGGGLAIAGNLQSINNILRKVEYQPELNFNGEDFITVAVADGKDSQNTASRTLTVSIEAVNDTPEIVTPYVVQTLEDSQVLIPGVSVVDSDFIVNADVSALLTVYVTAGKGKVSMSSAQVRFDTGTKGNAFSTLVITGGIYGINDALLTLEYVPEKGFHGIDTVTITASDKGHYGRTVDGPLFGMTLTGQGVTNIVVKSVDSPTNLLSKYCIAHTHSEHRGRERHAGDSHALRGADAGGLSGPDPGRVRGGLGLHRQRRCVSLADRLCDCRKRKGEHEQCAGQI